MISELRRGTSQVLVHLLGFLKTLAAEGMIGAATEILSELIKWIFDDLLFLVRPHVLFGSLPGRLTQSLVAGRLLTGLLNVHLAVLGVLFTLAGFLRLTVIFSAASLDGAILLRIGLPFLPFNYPFARLTDVIGSALMKTVFRKRLLGSTPIAELVVGLRDRACGRLSLLESKTEQASNVEST